MRKISKVLLSVIISLTVFLNVGGNAVAQFGTWPGCSRTGSIFGLAGSEVATLQGFECIVQFILNIVVRLAGIAALVMIILGGFQYLTSGGNPENTKKAWSTITWGIAGLAVLLGSWLILKFIQVLTNVDVTQFVIPS